jgi:hypothetical protein
LEGVGMNLPDNLVFGLIFKNMELIRTFEGWLKACKRRMAEHLTEGGTIGL